MTQWCRRAYVYTMDYSNNKPFCSLKPLKGRGKSVSFSLPTCIMCSILQCFVFTTHFILILLSGSVIMGSKRGALFNSNVPERHSAKISCSSEFIKEGAYEKKLDPDQREKFMGESYCDWAFIDLRYYLERAWPSSCVVIGVLCEVAYIVLQYDLMHLNFVY